GGSLLFVAVRCTLQYVLLPFVLPFMGLSNAISIVLSAIIDVIALGMIAYNIRRLWHTSWRTRYLVLSFIMVIIIGVFLYNDFSFFFNR
ncbi:MAG: hypothetical protein WEC37_00240, partial [Anaerolineales bacterium]